MKQEKTRAWLTLELLQIIFILPGMIVGMVNKDWRGAIKRVNKHAAHQHVSEILPWLLNNSLRDKERKRVLAHLRVCGQCRKERDQLQLLQSAIREDDYVPESEYRFAYSKLLRNIESAESSGALSSPRTESRLEGWRNIIAVGSLGIAAIVGVLLILPVMQSKDMQARQTQSNEFVTLTSPEKFPGKSKRIRLHMNQGVDDNQIREVLIKTGSVLLSASDSQGIYLVQMPVADGLSEEDLLNGLRLLEGVDHVALHIP